MPATGLGKPTNPYVARMARSYRKIQNITARRIKADHGNSGIDPVRASRGRAAERGAPTWPGSPGAIPVMSVGVVQGCTQRR